MIKTLYEASGIAQEKQVLPKTVNKAVKTDVPFEMLNIILCWMKY